MKRTLLLIVACGLIVGCERSAENQKQVQAEEKFKEAFKLSDQGTSGLIHEPLGEDASLTKARKLGAKVTGFSQDQKEKGIDLEEYRQEKQKAAADMVQGVSVGGAQQTAAKLFVGETRASAGRNAARKASRAWASQSDLLSRLVADASAIRVASAQIAAYGKVNYDKAIADARQALEKATADHKASADSAKEIKQAIAALQAEIKSLTDEQSAKVAQADEFSRKAFTARGRLQFDLYVQASQATREADSLSTKAESARAKMDIEQSKLKVEQANVDGLKKLAEDLEASVKGLRERADKIAQVVKALGDGVKELGDGFDAAFKELMAAQAEGVDKNFDAAVAALEEAVITIEGAGSGGDQTIHLLAARAELGHTQRQRMLVDKSLRDTLTSLLESLKDSQPARAETLAEPIKAADTRLQTARSKADEELKKAAAELTPLAETAKTGGDKAAEKNVLRHLIPVNRSLAGVTGDKTFADAAAQQAKRLEELAAP